MKKLYFFNCYLFITINNIINSKFIKMNIYGQIPEEMGQLIMLQSL